jgi:hypothetical protein
MVWGVGDPSCEVHSSPDNDGSATISAARRSWTFTRHDLDRLLHKLKQKPDRLAA